MATPGLPSKNRVLNGAVSVYTGWNILYNDTIRNFRDAVLLHRSGPGHFEI